MKIIKLSDLHSSLMPSVDILPDSAIQKTGKPFFIPDFAERFVCRVAVAAHICRLGKNIACKFANRYYDSIGLCFVLEAADLKDNLLGEGLPVAVATSFDGSVVLGDSYPVCADGHMTVTLSVDGKDLGNWEITSVNDMLDSSIELISRYFTLKIGDCVILDFGMGNCELVIGSHLSAVINGKESVNVKIK